MLSDCLYRNQPSGKQTMSLLRDIQEATIDTSVPLSTLLRKCKILASRLGSAEFNSWIDNELNGYSSREIVPEYRILPVNSKGHFSGPYGSGMKYADIPLTTIPEKFRDNLRKSYLMTSIASLESLVEDSDGGTAQEPWNPDLVAHVGQGIYVGMNCMQAWKVIPMNLIVAALDSVRTRILNFVLKIEAEDPEAGEAPINSIPVHPDKVTQIFNTYIAGNVGNMATGGESVRQRANLESRDSEVFEQMLSALSNATADRDLIKSVSEIVEEMRDAKESSSFKEIYQKFMGVLADHIQVLGPVLSPYLAGLATILSKQ